MSQTNIIYPQSTDRTPFWQVREEHEGYDNATLIALQDRISDRLERAEALACLLQVADDYLLDRATRTTATIIEELIQQAREANSQMWEYVRSTLKDE